MLFDSEEQIQQWRDEAENTDAVLATGYPTFDKMLKRGGIRKGQTMAIAARSGVGKSWMACNMAVRMALAGHSILFSSQEMTVPEVVTRLISIAYGLPVFKVEEKLEKGTLDRHWLTQYERDFQGMTIYPETEPTFDDLAHMIGQHEKRTTARPLAIIQDYSDLMSHRNIIGNPVTKASENAKKFAKLAKDEGVAVISLVQTGRASEGDSSKRDHGHRMVTKESILYGGEQSWAYIAGLWRPDKDPDASDTTLLQGSNAERDRYFRAIEKAREWKGLALMNLAKNRFGPEDESGIVLKLDWTTGQWKDRLAECPEEVSAPNAVEPVP